MKAITFILLFGFFGAQLAGAATASAQPAIDETVSPEAQQAHQHFNLGVKLYSEGDFGPALAQFQRAYELKPHFRVLYNIAQCHFELRDYVQARAALGRYLAGGGATLDAERRARIEADLDDLGHRISRLHIRSNVRGAGVYVDGRRVGTTPLSEGIEVNEGQRSVSVESAGQGIKQRSLLLVGGESQTITVNFERIDAASASSAAGSRRGGSPPPPAESGLGTGFVLASVGTVVFGAGAGVAGYLALTAEKERRADLDRLGVSAEELAADRRQIRTFAITSDALLGGAVLCAGLATTLFVVRQSETSPELAVGPGHVALRGAF